MTAATAGIIKVDNPASAPTVAPKITRFSLGPDAAAADNNYGIRVKRQTTGGTWTAVTPEPNDPANAASKATAGVASTVAGTSGSTIAVFGFNQRAGFMFVAVPGGEWVVARAVSNGIIIEFVYAQGTDTCRAALEFEE